MDWLSVCLPFIKILGAFALMLLCIRCKIGLGLSLLAGGMVMGLLFGLGLLQWGQTGVLALTKEKFLFLSGIVGLILILSDGLDRSGQSRRIMDNLSGYLTAPRLRLIFFPALIGLLPMPGGAVFSAPMVKAVSEDMAINNIERAAINYWFRHVWELAWPLYPGIILTVALADIPLSAFISKSWPGVVAMFVFGWFFLLRPVSQDALGADFVDNAGRRDIRAALQEGLPLLIAIFGAIGLETMISVFLPGVAFEWGVIVALVLAIAALMIRNRLGLFFVGEVLSKRSLWSMLFVIAAIFVFKDIMQAAGVVTALAQAAGDRAALFAAAIILPFLVGLVAGINVAFVGATFPLLLGFIEVLGVQEQTVAYLVLATFAGFTGVMISPIHICFLLTCEFFHTELAITWRRLVLPCCCFAVTGCGLFFVLI